MSWNISDSSYTGKTIDIFAQGLQANGTFFNDTGTKMYIGGGSSIDQYNLSTPWDVTTASYNSVRFSVSSQIAFPSGITGLYFKDGGTKMYVLSATATHSVFQYSLSTPWDLSTASYDSVSYNVTQATNITQLFIGSSGTKMYVGNRSTSLIYQYTLGTPWVVSSASYDGSFNSSSQVYSPVGIFFRPNGTRLFLVDSGSTSDPYAPVIYQYTLATPWDVTTATYDGVSFALNPPSQIPASIYFKPDGLKFYIGEFTYSASSTSVYEYQTFGTNLFIQIVQMVGIQSGEVQTINAGKADDGEPIFYELETQELEFSNRANLKKISDKLTVFARDGAGSSFSAKADEGNYKPIPMELDRNVNIGKNVDLEGNFFTFKWSGQTDTVSPTFGGFIIEDIDDMGITKQ